MGKSKRRYRAFARGLYDDKRQPFAMLWLVNTSLGLLQDKGPLSTPRISRDHTGILGGGGAFFGIHLILTALHDLSMQYTKIFCAMISEVEKVRRVRQNFQHP